MLCESCHEQEATVHLTQVIEGNVKKLHLCEACAKKSGFDVQGTMSITDILLGMGAAPEASEDGEERSCPRCHLRRSDFKKLGRLGCPDCYETFAAELLPLIKSMHRSEQHVGKVPAGESTRLQFNADIKALQEELERAIAKEQFEEAARIRDRLQALREKARGPKDSP